MKAVIDRAGRIVVPKPLRQALGLKPGQPLEIRAGDGRLEIEIASTPMQLKKRGKGLVAVPEAKLPPLTAVRAPACRALDRKSTRLNSSHSQISYAVFCLKKTKRHRALPGRPR